MKKESIIKVIRQIREGKEDSSIQKGTKTLPYATKIVKKIVHEVHVQSPDGQWLHHSTHDSEKEAENSRKAARVSVKQSREGSWEGADSHGAPRRNPYGEVV
jgi:hypothetical protein